MLEKIGKLVEKLYSNTAKQNYSQRQDFHITWRRKIRGALDTEFQIGSEMVVLAFCRLQVAISWCSGQQQKTTTTSTAARDDLPIVSSERILNSVSFHSFWIHSPIIGMSPVAQCNCRPAAAAMAISVKAKAVPQTLSFQFQ